MQSGRGRRLQCREASQSSIVLDSLMVSRAKEVGPRRYRESAGRYYEDFEIGDVYEHRPGRTLTEADNIWFSLLTMNQHPLHIDSVCGAATPSMTGWITSALLLAAVTTASAAADEPIAIGAVVSESGAHAAPAAEYRKGLLLWQEELNAAGGLLGRRVELRFKDDGSEAVRAGEAYAELIRDGAQVLIGPYGSAATLTAAAEAERARRVLLNAAGPSSEIHKRQPQYVFQTLPPYAAYADGPLWAAREAA